MAGRRTLEAVKQTARARARHEDDGTRPLGEVLGFLRLLWAIAHGLESISKRMRATMGITGPQRLVIRLIGRLGSAAPSELAGILHVSPSSLTGVLRRLERAGLIRRAANPRDGRRAILTLTTRGQALNDQDLGTVESAVRRTLRGFSPRELALTRNVLAALAGELGGDVAGSSRPRQPSGRRRASKLGRRPAR